MLREILSRKGTRGGRKARPGSRSQASRKKRPKTEKQRKEAPGGTDWFEPSGDILIDAGGYKTAVEGAGPFRGGRLRPKSKAWRDWGESKRWRSVTYTGPFFSYREQRELSTEV